MHYIVFPFLKCIIIIMIIIIISWTELNWLITITRSCQNLAENVHAPSQAKVYGIFLADKTPIWNRFFSNTWFFFSMSFHWLYTVIHLPIFYAIQSHILTASLNKCFSFFIIIIIIVVYNLYTLIWRRKLWIALCWDLDLEEALDLS
jgi:hypothetical protein